MPLRPDDYEIAAFFALLLIFELGERAWPAHRIDRLADLRLDVLSFAFALAVNRLCTSLFRETLSDLTPTPVIGFLHLLQGWPSAVRLVAAIIVADFALYWIHRAQHTFEVLWRTHAWHHSIEQMYWFSGFRTSFLHSFLYNLPQVVVPVGIFQLSPFQAGIGFSLGVLIQFVEHTNWKIPFGPFERFIVTPEYHRVHHSASVQRGKNLAFTFRIWDRLFGTYVDPATMPADFALGLGVRVPAKDLPRLLAGV